MKFLQEALCFTWWVCWNAWGTDWVETCGRDANEKTEAFHEVCLVIGHPVPKGGGFRTDAAFCKTFWIYICGCFEKVQWDEDGWQWISRWSGTDQSIAGCPISLAKRGVRLSRSFIQWFSFDVRFSFEGSCSSDVMQFHIQRFERVSFSGWFVGAILLHPAFPNLAHTCSRSLIRVHLPSVDIFWGPHCVRQAA